MTLPTRVNLSDTFRLHSNPTATKTIYLDFNGHITTRTNWNNKPGRGATIATPAFSTDADATTFSDAELERIQYIWQRVAEDYMPFGIDVTTEDPGDDALLNTGGTDNRWGIRVAIGGSNADWYKASATGAGYHGSFGLGGYGAVCFTFSNNLGKGNEKSVAEVSSHEAGHTLNLNHDGKHPSTEYYKGHGTGPTGWAPIMGNSNHKALTQWSQGEYAGARNYKGSTTNQDDIDIIANGERSGAGFRSDDFGDSAATATVLSGPALSQFGIIATRTDSDWFSFSTGNGPVSLSVSTALRAWVSDGSGGFSSHILAGRSPNLDIAASLFAADGTLIATSNPLNKLSASFNLSLAAGTYCLMVDGVGFGDPATNGYSDYGSLGGYLVTGTLI
jgi:hypothetical protein